MPFELTKSEWEFISARNDNDWKKLHFLADKVKSGALYTGAKRLCYACQFFYSYYETRETALLEALYEQMVNVTVQTKRAALKFSYSKKSLKSDH